MISNVPLQSAKAQRPRKPTSTQRLESAISMKKNQVDECLKFGIGSDEMFEIVSVMYKSQAELIATR